MALLAAIPSIIGMFKGDKDIQAGKDLAASNKRPIYEDDTDKYYQEMLQLYEKNAQYGLDANSMAFATDQNNRGLTRSLNTMLQGGGNPNQVAGLYDEYATNVSRTAAMDSEMRWNKVNAVAGAIDKLAKEQQALKTTEFLYNEDAPYKDTAQLAAAKQQAGEQAFYGSLDTGVGNVLKVLNQNYQTKALTDAMKLMYGNGLPPEVAPRATVPDIEPINANVPDAAIQAILKKLTGSLTIANASGRPGNYGMVGPQPY